MRTVAIISPHFPPATLAGVHRARHIAKYLPALGWHPIIIRADERHYTEQLDPELAALVPPAVEQVRTGAFSARLARCFGIGDIGFRGYHHFRLAISDIAQLQNINAVLITGSPFYPMLLARHVRKKLKLPVILDFQDPWVSAEGATRPYFSKARMAHRLAKTLEPRAVRAASWITSVSDTQNAEMAARYPWLNAAHMSAIPIGGDPDDFVALRQAPPKEMAVRLDPALIHFCYVGTFLPRAGGVVRALFRAVALLRRHEPELAACLRFNFVGTSNQPARSSATGVTHRVMPIAAEEGVADLVMEHPARVPFLEALSLLANAHAILMLGSDEPHYTASKIYPALMSGRPWLSIFHQQSSAHDILSRAGGGAAFSFGLIPELEMQAEALCRSLVQLAQTPECFGNADPSVYADYTARAVAGQFAGIFENLAHI